MSLQLTAQAESKTNVELCSHLSSDDAKKKLQNETLGSMRS